jgi:serine/threonine protein phosphatase PrpC
MPGLAMSRSIGDGMAKSLGVIAEPEVNITDIKEKKVFGIALASDGIWDVYISEDFSNLIMKLMKLTDMKDLGGHIMSLT